MEERHVVHSLCIGLFVLLWPWTLAAAKPARTFLSGGGDRAAIVVLRRSGVLPYEALIERFRSDLRTPIQVVGLDDEPAQTSSMALRAKLFFAVGQHAHDWAVSTGLQPLLQTFVYRAPSPSALNVSAIVHPDRVLEMIRGLIPKARSVFVLAGPSTRHLASVAQNAAKRFGIDVTTKTVPNAGAAIRALHDTVSAPVHAVWLLPDIDVLTSHVLRYAIAMQYRRGIPLIGATRYHVVRGALLALDFAPDHLGREAARIANRFLASRRQRKERPKRNKDLMGLGKIPCRTSVNATAAQALRLPLLTKQSEIEVIR